MPAYLVVDLEITDPEAFERYQREVAPNLASFGARNLARAGRTTVLEGDWSRGRCHPICSGIRTEATEQASADSRRPSG